MEYLQAKSNPKIDLLFNIAGTLPPSPLAWLIAQKIFHFYI
jgi:hypothetical protein